MGNKPNKELFIVYSWIMDAKKLISHRGDNTNYPENSYAGIEAALKAGALYVEFDVQMNADKSLVVIHDTDFKRTANNASYLFNIGDAKMQKISIHEPLKFKDQHEPLYTSFLSDILALFKQYPKAQALVEIKRESVWYWGLDIFMKQFMTALSGHENQSIIISFGLETLEYTKTNSNLRIGMVFYDYQSCNYELAKILKPDFMIASHLIVPDKKLWKGDWKWVIYSINNIADATKMLNRDDVDMIETDDICLLLAANE